jgi:hypothetical protein
VVVRGVGTLPQLASSYVLLLMHGVIEVFVAVHTIHHLAGVLHLRSSAVFFRQKVSSHSFPAGNYPETSPHPAPQLLCGQGVGWFAESSSASTTAPTLRSVSVLLGGVCAAPPAASSAAADGTTGRHKGAGALSNGLGRPEGVAGKGGVDPLASTACSAIADFSLDTLDGDGVSAMPTVLGSKSRYGGVCVLWDCGGGGGGGGKYEQNSSLSANMHAQAAVCAA